jgi:uncharacterized Rossmann fold enzyme
MINFDQEKMNIEYSKAAIWYEKICKIFGFDVEKDLIARDLLFSYKKGQNIHPIIEDIKRLIKTRFLLFFGAGPNLFAHLSQIGNKIARRPKEYFIVAADGSASGLKLFNIKPNIIMTDLDGLNLSELRQFINQDVICFVHGHGDNIQALQKFSHLIKESNNIIGTTQNQSRYPIINPGGFTDGDRGLYLLHHISPLDKSFWLFGYEFKDRIGAYSKKEFPHSVKMTEMKKKKMEIAQQLINNLKKEESRSLHIYGDNPIEDLRIKQELQK